MSTTTVKCGTVLPSQDPLVYACIDAARSSGEDAGTATRYRNVALTRRVRARFRKWLAMQPAENKRTLDDAYNVGYTEGYGSLYL